MKPEDILTPSELRFMNGPLFETKDGLPGHIYWFLPLFGIVYNRKVANTTEVCRGFNRTTKERCNNYVGWKGDSRLEVCKRNGCTLNYFEVLKGLKILEKLGKVKSKKRRFYDSRRYGKTDLFRFWFFEDSDFHEIILKQTLDGWL